MSKVILIIGLPGSGKTYLAKTKYVPLGYTLVDDPLDRNHIDRLLYAGHDLVITDPHLCNESTRELAYKHLHNMNCVVSMVFFENNVEKCKKLIELRNDGRNIKTFSAFNYKIPKNVIPLKIYEPEGKIR